MKYMTQAAASFAMLGAVALAPVPSFAQTRCDTPNGMIDQRACAKAAEGPQALRRFVERTRPIYGLYYFDYARRDNAAVADAAPVEPGRTAVASARPAGANSAP